VAPRPLITLRLLFTLVAGFAPAPAAQGVALGDVSRGRPGRDLGFTDSDDSRRSARGDDAGCRVCAR
jgi:hypothetical protein